MIDWFADRFWRWWFAFWRWRGRPWERHLRGRGLYPAYADWCGAFAVDRQGVVWFSAYPDNWSEPEPVVDRAIHFAVLAVATRRHAAIAHLRPERTATDIDCPTCHGLGYPRQLKPRHRHWIICQCGGLGWVPRDMAAPPAFPVSAVED